MSPAKYEPSPLADLDPGHVTATRRWANLYHARGYQPLPSEPGRKKPMCRFAEWWEGGGPTPDELWDRFPTTNVQVMTGRFWRLAVLDLDGPEAIAHLPNLGPKLPHTWVSHSGGGGEHWWFSVPDGPEMTKRLLWGVWDATAREGRGAWEKRKAIEFLGDRSLVMAPPSIHPRTGRVYKFLSGRSPKDLPRPALLPHWVYDLPTMQPPAKPCPEATAVGPAANVARRTPGRALPGGVSRDDVLDAIPDKVAVARGWGVRVVDEAAGPTGWVSCHDIDREDRNPSARFHPAAGLFWRPDGEKPMSLFDLGVAVGHYATWLDCCASLAEAYMPASPRN